MQADVRVAHFIIEVELKKALPKKCLCESVNDCASQYKKEIEQHFTVILPRLAEGYKRGAMFGFGPKAQDDTGKLLKIAKVTDGKKMKKLKRTSVHNVN